jgi:HSP20 family protein
MLSRLAGRRQEDAHEFGLHLLRAVLESGTVRLSEESPGSACGRGGTAMAGYERDFMRNILSAHRHMERFLNDVLRYGHSMSPAGRQSWSPPIDVFETENSYVVRVEVAGLELNNLEVTFDDGRLTISGYRVDRGSEERVICHQMEIPYGHFTRTIDISRNVDGDSITASYAAGFLEIRLPRSRPVWRKKVEIRLE